MGNDCSQCFEASHADVIESTKGPARAAAAEEEVAANIEPPPELVPYVELDVLPFVRLKQVLAKQGACIASMHFPESLSVLCNPVLPRCPIALIAATVCVYEPRGMPVFAALSTTLGAVLSPATGIPEAELERMRDKQSLLLLADERIGSRWIAAGHLHCPLLPALLLVPLLALLLAPLLALLILPLVLLLLPMTLLLLPMSLLLLPMSLLLLPMTLLLLPMSLLLLPMTLLLLPMSLLLLPMTLL